MTDEPDTAVGIRRTQIVVLYCHTAEPRVLFSSHRALRIRYVFGLEIRVGSLLHQSVSDGHVFQVMVVT